LKILSAKVQEICGDLIQETNIQNNELTIKINKNNLVAVCEILKNNPTFSFSQLMDICGVDYLHYGLDEWATNSATATGFSRGVTSVIDNPSVNVLQEDRFAVVYHLLSLTHNFRIRLKVFLNGGDDPLMVPSVVALWNNANWYEREVFDLFGIIFENHPDMRRILTDYGFVGHPLRKDFPLIGNVEVKYDEKQKRVVNQPVSIEARTLVPKVIRSKG
jgi:NADH-quinone oxidoreductase subunit C